MGPAPTAGSPLSRAFTVQHDASLRGFDWEDPRDALEKVREETEEVGSLLANRCGADADGATDGTPSHRDSGGPDDRLYDELGDLLFAVVNVARLAGVDPRAALVRATSRFEERFAALVRLARRRGLRMPGTPLADLDRLWDEIKAGEEG